MGRTYHRTPFKSCTSLYSPEAKMGSQKGDEEKKDHLLSQMTFKSSFYVPLVVVEDSKSGCIFPMYNESFFTDNPLELI